MKKSTVVIGTGRVACVAALALVAGTAGAAIDGRISMSPAAGVVEVGGSVQVNAFGRFPATAFALASTEFDVSASMKGWSWASGGAIAGPDVLGIAFAQTHNPFGGPAADPSNPMRVWGGQFTPDSYAPALVGFKPAVSGFSYYPSPLTASAIETGATEGAGYVLVNPTTLGAARVAPGEGTTVEPVGGGLAIESPGEEPILIGLLLPAVQKVREAASRQADALDILVQPPQSSGACCPTESLTLGYTKATWTYNVNVNRPGAYLTEVCHYTGHVLICLIDNESDTGSFQVERIPDSHSFRTEFDPVLGATTVIATLEWDEPVLIGVEGTPAGQTVRLQIRSVSNAGPGGFEPGPHVIVFDGHDLGQMSMSFAAACEPDLSGTAIAGTPGYGAPDGVVNNEDFFYYLAQFAAGNVAAADLTTGAMPGKPGYGVPDGVLNNDDFFYYLAVFSRGC